MPSTGFIFASRFLFKTFASSLSSESVDPGQQVTINNKK